MDHDHDTLKFRGFLCNSCNRKLAWYEKEKDNIIYYLNNNRKVVGSSPTEGVK